MSAKALRLPVEIFGRSGYDDYYIFCLPSAGRDALLSMSHRLYWSIWTDEDGSRISLNDEQMALIDATVAELTGGVQVQCLEEQFDRLIEVIQSISINVNSGGSSDMSVINNCVSCGGCGCSQCNGGSYPWGDDPTADPFPQEPSSDPTYPGEADPAAWCDRSTEIASRYVSVFTNLETWWDGVQVTADTILVWLETKLGPLGYAWTLMLSVIATALTFILTNSLTEAMKTLAENMLDALVCAVYNSESPAQAKANFEATISLHTADSSLPVKTIMAAVAKIIDWDKVFDLDGIATLPIYENSDCSNCEGGGGGGGEPDPSTEPQQVEDEAWYMCPVLSVEYDSGNAQRFHQVESGTNLWEMVATSDGLNVVRFNPHPHGFGDVDLESVAAQDGYVVTILEGGEGIDTGFSNWLAGGSCMHPYGKFSNHPGVNCFYHIRPGLAGGDLETAFLAYAAGQGWSAYNLGDDMDKTRMSFECRSDQEERWTCQIWLIVPEEDVNVPE